MDPKIKDKEKRPPTLEELRERAFGGKTSSIQPEYSVYETQLLKLGVY